MILDNFDKTFIMNFITTYINMFFLFALLFFCLSNKTKAGAFKTALQFSALAYAFGIIVNTMKLFLTNNVFLFKIIIFVALLIHILLLTYTLVILIDIDIAKLVRKKLFREFILTLTLSLLFFMVIPYFHNDDNKICICLLMYLMFYIYLLVKYTIIFKKSYHLFKKKMDNYYSGDEIERIKWINNTFNFQLIVGILIPISCFFLLEESMIYFIFLIIFFAYYLYFAISLISYGFIYDRLYKPFSNSTIQELKTTKTGTVSKLESNLVQWINQKTFTKQGITIDETARMLGTNRNYLSKYINSTMNKTFNKWINQLRVEHSKTLMLENPKITINETAAETGFTDKSHFIRQFINETGKSPSQWRQETIKSHQCAEYTPKC